MNRVNDLFDKLASEERDFMDSEFFAPALRNKPVRVRVSNIVMDMKIVEPARFEGWGVFRPRTSSEATFVRSPTMQEQTDYFSLFPCLLYTSPSPRDRQKARMPSSA